MNDIAVIGCTGLVGSTIVRQFGTMGIDVDKYNSKNIENIVDKNYHMVINAGVSGTKWKANLYPADDIEKIEKLKSYLITVTTTDMVHISTVDVFGFPMFVDERSVPLHSDHDVGNYYGIHRLDLENWMLDNFSSTRIFRLPGLFGEGLTKNPIYDLTHDHRVSSIATHAVYQWYDVSGILENIHTKFNKINHIVTPPITMLELCSELFPEHLDNIGMGNKPQYNVLSVDDFTMQLPEVINRIRTYRDTVRNGMM